MTKERRRYFRIHDYVGLSWRVLSEEEIQQQPETDKPADSFGLMSSYNVRIESLLGQLRIKDPLTGELIDAINKKLNCVINQMENEAHTMQRVAQKVQEVNISACGIGFIVDEAVVIGSQLALELQLRPSNLQVFASGEVISCDEAATKGDYYLRVDFNRMEHHDQEILIQHIVKRQTTLHREALNKYDPDTDAEQGESASNS